MYERSDQELGGGGWWSDPDPFFYVEGWIRSISIPGLPALTIVTGVPYISANIHCKSRNLPNTDVHDYSTDLR